MNNLSDREKYLVYAIIGILPVVVLYFGFTYFMGELTKRKTTLRSATAKLNKMQNDANYATVLVGVKNDLRQRSLAAGKTAANNEYRDWLVGLVENELKFDGTPNVKPKATIPIKSDVGNRELLYNQLNFQLDCVGNYKQIVDLLYKFYEKNYIHRIERLTMNLARKKGSDGQLTFDRGRFNVQLQIQVLSLVDADEERTPEAVENIKLFYDAKESEKHLSELDDYYAMILRRNLFGFPNNAPDFGAREKDFEFEEGEKVSIRLTADDEDDDDMEFSLVSVDGKVKSDQIEAASGGRFKLDISELGEYKFKARVTDKNYYPKSDEMSVVVIIEKKKEEKKEEPKKKDPPKFDHTKFTVIYAVNSNIRGERFCGIEVRTLGKDYKLQIGDEFKVGDAEAKIIDINSRHAVIELDGKRYAYAAGDILGDPQGDEIAFAAPPKPSPDADEESGKADSESSDTEVSGAIDIGESLDEGDVTKEQKASDSNETEVAKAEDSPN